MRVLRKLFFGVISLVLIGLFTFNIYHFICTNLLKQELPKFFGYSLLEVVSGSMEPTIHIGDLILIDTKVKDYQVGDIITFRDEYTSFVTHRIVSLDGDLVTTKGDANNVEDPSFSKDRIVGKKVLLFPQFGILISSLQNPFVLGFIFLIGVLVCYLISTDRQGNPIFDEEEAEYIEFLKYREKKKKQSDEMIVEEKTESCHLSSQIANSNPIKKSSKKKKNQRRKKKKRKAKKRRR